MTDRVVSLAVSLHHSQSIQPKLSIDNRPVVSKMMTMVSPFFFSDTRESNKLFFSVIEVPAP